jgi:hypothetical protein
MGKEVKKEALVFKAPNGYRIFSFRGFIYFLEDFTVFDQNSIDGF